MSKLEFLDKKGEKQLIDEHTWIHKMVKKQAEIDKTKANADLDDVPDEDLSKTSPSKSAKKSLPKNFQTMNKTFTKKNPEEELQRLPIPFGVGHRVVSPKKPKTEKLNPVPVKKQSYTLDGLPVKLKKRKLIRIGADPLGGLEEDQFARLEEDEKELILDSVLQQKL